MIIIENFSLVLIISLIATPFMYLLFCWAWNKKEMDTFFMEIVIFLMAFSCCIALVVVGFYFYQLLICLEVLK